MKKAVCLSLIICILLSICAFPAVADTAETNPFTAEGFATAVSASLSQIDAAINTGTVRDGVRTGIAFPEMIIAGRAALSAPEFAYVAAQTVLLLSEGEPVGSALHYCPITLGSEPAEGSAMTSISKADCLLLASHVKSYAESTQTLPTSFCLADGTRICIYSVCRIFAKALSDYGTNHQLPGTVSFTPTDFTVTQSSAVSNSYPKVLTAAMYFADYVEEHHAVPSTVPYNGGQISKAKLLKLMCDAVIGINNGTTSGMLSYGTQTDAPNPAETLDAAGTLAKSAYVTMLQNTVNFMNNNDGDAPNYTSCSLGQLRYEHVCYMAAFVLREYLQTGALPAFYTVTSWENVLSATAEISVSDFINGVWLWGGTVYDSGTNGAARIMAAYAASGITDVYLLVKGNAGSCAWNTSVPGATRSHSDRDVLRECCTAAAPYGIRIHCWMMAARDDNYLSKHSDAAYYHFRCGTTDEVIRYVNLRNTGYINYTKSLVSEILANYNVAGIHFDTIRYGALYYDWGAETRSLLLGTYGLTKAQYNAAVKALCVNGSYKYTTNSNGYYIYSSSGTSASGRSLTDAISLNDGSDLAIGAKAVYNMRTDTVKNFVSQVSSVAGNSVISCATMPECATSKSSTLIYGQDSAKLGTVTDYICPMSYDLDYGASASWVKTIAKNIAATGANVVAGIEAYDAESGTEATGTTVYNAMYYARQAAAEAEADTGITGKVLGCVFFRGWYLGLSGLTYDAQTQTADMVFYAPDAAKVTKLTVTLQGDMTVDTSRLTNGISNKMGWGSASVSVSSDKKTITIYNNGSTLLSAKGSGAGFTVALKGTPDTVRSVARVNGWNGSDALIYCNLFRTTKEEPEPEEPPVERSHSDCNGDQIEFWKTGNNTHYAFCYECGNGYTEECVMRETSRIPATCTATGTIVSSCRGGVNPETHETEYASFCADGGCGNSRTSSIPTQGHTITAATDNGTGTHTGYCDNCGTAVISTHTYDNGVCTLCGAHGAAVLYSPQTDLTSADEYVIACCVQGKYYAISQTTDAKDGTDILKATRLYLDKDGNAIICDGTDYLILTSSEQTNSYTGRTGSVLQTYDGMYLVLPNKGISFSTYNTNGIYTAEAAENGAITLKLDDTALTRYLSYAQAGQYFCYAGTASPLYLFGASYAQILHRGEPVSELSVQGGSGGTLTYSLNTAREIVYPEWTSDDPSVLSIDGTTGAWTALSEGTATVTVILHTYDQSQTDYRSYKACIEFTVSACPHTHEMSCACGTSENTVMYLPLTQTSGVLPAGSYYLNSDLTLTGNLTTNGTVNLCLNGHTLTVGNKLLTVGNGSTLNLCDCMDGGTVRASSYGVAINGGTFNQYGGMIRTEGTGICYGAEVENGGNLYLYGGSISVLTTGTSAFGIRNYSTGTVQIMDGNVLVNGTSTSYYGIYNYSTGIVSVSGGSVTAPFAMVNNGTMTLTGGTVSATTYAAVLVNGTCNLSGSPSLNGATADFYIGNGLALSVTGPVRSTEPYTVQTRTAPSAGTDILFTSGFGTAMAETVDPAEVFAAWNSRYAVIEKNSELALHLHQYTTKVTAPTCTEGGYTTRSCACGASYTENPVSALGHLPAEIPAVAATCTSPAQSAGSRCTRCNEVLLAPAPVGVPSGHQYEYTYLNNGKHSGTCSACGAQTEASYCAFENGICPDCGAQFKISSAALRLNQDINVIFTVKVPAGLNNPHMVFTMNGKDTTVSTYTAASDGQLQFVYTGVTPQCMGDNITATLYATCGGNEYSVSLTQYSIRTYCTDLLQQYPEDQPLVTLLSDLLTYGAAAQLYTEYETDQLVTVGLALTPTEYSPISGKEVSFTGAAAEDTDWTGASLILSNDLSTRIFFFTCSTEDLLVKCSINGRTQYLEDEDFTAVEGKDGIYYFDLRNISATEFDDVVSVRFFRDGIASGRTMNYSVNAYICSTQNTDNPTLQALVRALYCYGASAAAYGKMR